jgi:hypothetical protein
VDSVALGFMVFLAAWFLVKRFKKKSANPTRRVDKASQSQARRMPRVGTPGTVTKDQMERLRAQGFEPSKHWSIEEADMVLDTVVYLRGVWNKAVSKQSAPVEIQNHLLAHILSDPEMREYIRRWGAELREKGEDAKPTFPRTKIFERVAAEALHMIKQS